MAVCTGKNWLRPAINTREEEEEGLELVQQEARATVTEPAAENSAEEERCCGQLMRKDSG